MIEQEITTAEEIAEIETVETASLEEKIQELEARIATLEKSAHTEHTIGREAVKTIATMAVQIINERIQLAQHAELRKTQEELQIQMGIKER